MTETSDHISEASASVQTHLGILQGVIERMAANSTACKTWCITIVSAILVVVADKDKPKYVLIAFIPTFLFMCLDTYYLAMEKGFRNSYNSFVKKLHSSDLEAEDLYAVKPESRQSNLQLEAVKSFSVWGFYLVLAAMIALARFYILTPKV